MELFFFSVRSIIRCMIQGSQVYEERVTLWKTDSLDSALLLSENEAREYARDIGGTMCELLQACKLDDDVVFENGREVFSLMRVSDLDCEEYLNKFFDTGDERSQ